jgi:energy-coupling factor transporter ATP-binding protein EcfA2
MGDLLVVTGPPGAGKSTVARLVSAGFPRSVVVAGDAFFAFLDQGAVLPWLPGSEQQNDVVTEAAALAAGRFARETYMVVYDGVVGPWYLPRFAEWTRAAPVHYVILLPDAATCRQRVRDRVGHGFADLDAADDLHRQFAAARVNPRHVLAPPPHEPEGTAALIRHRLASGALRVEADSVSPRPAAP